MNSVQVRSHPILGRHLMRIGLLTVSVAAIFPSGNLYGQTSMDSGSRPASEPAARIILEVVNQHFTRGKKIPSIYLRIFSDGTAECHNVKFTGDEKEVVKKERLKPENFSQLKAALEQPGLRDVKGSYGLPRLVLDSWMEWNLRIRTSQFKRVATISFGPAAHKTTYPEALGKLGCQILRTREDVCGDNDDYYRPACVNQSSN